MTLRIGVVGSGFMGSTHAAAWRRTPAQLLGIHSVDPVSMGEVAAQYHAHPYATFEALLADVDVVDICTPTYLHHEMVLKAATAGKQIICEKPLARSYREAQEMIAACAKAGVRLLVAQVVRFFPEYALAKATVARGEIGRVGVVRLTRCSFKPARNNPESWFHDEAKSGGMMFDLMIHDFDYARWVAGEVESVFAKNIQPRFPEASGDYALAILRHTDGAISHVEGGWAYPAPMFRTALEIAGERGLIEHPAGSSAPIAVYLHGAETGSNPDIGLPRSPLAEDPYTTQIKHFYEVLTGKVATPRVTAADGAAAVRIALAAIESARSGGRVRIEEIL